MKTNPIKTLFYYSTNIRLDSLPAVSTLCKITYFLQVQIKERVHTAKGTV